MGISPTQSQSASQKLARMSEVLINSEGARLLSGLKLSR